MQNLEAISAMPPLQRLAAYSLASGLDISATLLVQAVFATPGIKRVAVSSVVGFNPEFRSDEPSEGVYFFQDGKMFGTTTVPQFIDHVRHACERGGTVILRVATDREVNVYDIETARFQLRKGSRVFVAGCSNGTVTFFSAQDLDRLVSDSGEGREAAIEYGEWSAIISAIGAAAVS